MDPSAKAQQIDPDAHPGAMIALMLSPEQQQALRDAFTAPDAEADHVTLCYLGPDAAALAPAKNALLTRLAAIATDEPPLVGEIGGIARFAASESSDNQDVIVALYDSPDLPDLYADIVECLEGCGLVPASDHGFTPHITLTSVSPDVPMTVDNLTRLPLSFAAISLIWGGERIDLPLLGMEETDQAQYAGETMEDWDDKALGTEGLADGAALVPEDDQEEAEPEDEDEAGKSADGPIAHAPGGAVKALPGNPYAVQTRGIVWGGHDLEGDSFIKGETDLGRSRSFVGMPVFYDHAARGIKSQIGTVTGADEDDEGIVFAVELDRSKAYIKDVLALERESALGSSTGAVGHLVRRKKGILKRWIVGEISFTPTPMEPRTHAAFAGKSLTEEDNSMGDENQPTTTDQDTAGVAIAQLATDVKALTSTVQGVRSDLDAIRSLPAVKNRNPQAAAEALGGAYGGGLQERAREVPGGYHYFKALTAVSHPGRPTALTLYPEGIFGGFVKAIFNTYKPSPSITRDAIKALEEVYGASTDSDGAKALGTQAGVSGAYLIPEQFIPTLMAIAQQNDVLYGRTMVIPVDGGEIVIPALDPSTSYSEGQSAYYGGVTVTWSTDDAAGTLTEPKFKQLRLKTNALKALTRLANQLMMRSAVAIDAVVSNLLGAAIGRARDYALIRGTGSGQPLGFINSPATIDVGGSAIDFATLAGMEDNVIPERDDNYVWLIHTKKRSAIWALQQTNNTLVTLLPNLRDRPTTTLLGRPIAFTDKTPFASGDISNTVNLVDPSMIVVAEFQGIALAVSDQARFEQDETVVRAIMSMDAQPWLTNKVAVTATPDYVSGFITI